MPRIGTGHTNLATLLGLNRDAITRMGDEVTGMVDKENLKAQDGLNAAYDAWAKQATHEGGGGAGWEEWLSKNGGGEVQAGLNSAHTADMAQGSHGGRIALIQKQFRSGGGAMDAALLGAGGNDRFTPQHVQRAGPNAVQARAGQAGEHTARLQKTHDDAMAEAKANRERENAEMHQRRRAEQPARTRENIQRRNNPFGP